MIDRGIGAKNAVRKVLGSIEREPSNEKDWQRRWRDLIRITRELLKGGEVCRQAILPEHRKGLMFLVRLVSRLHEAGLVPVEAAAVHSQAASDTAPFDPGDEASGRCTSQAEPAKKSLRVVPKAQVKVKAKAG
jgi:hypothetical protein